MILEYKVYLGTCMSCVAIRTLLVFYKDYSSISIDVKFCFGNFSMGNSRGLLLVDSGQKSRKKPYIIDKIYVVLGQSPQAFVLLDKHQSIYDLYFY